MKVKSNTSGQNQGKGGITSGITLRRRKHLRSVTVASPHTSKKMTSKGRLSSCNPSSQDMKLSRTLDRDSTGKEKGLSPFWNKRCLEHASNLWLPTEIDFAGSDLSLLNGSLKGLVDGSWFSVKLAFPRMKNSLPIFSVSSTFFPADCTGCDLTKTRLNRLHPNRQQRSEWRYWTDVSRYVYNWTIDFIKSCVDFFPHWMEIKKYATRFLPKWTKRCPFQIKAIAIKEAWGTFRKHWYKTKYRSRKNPVQSCFIPKSAIKIDGIYPRVSGRNSCTFTEELPEVLMDSRLVWRAGRWFLAVPSRYKHAPNGDNQAHVCAVDPGVRTFVAFYADSMAGLIGDGDYGRIYRMCMHLDDLISRASKAGKQKKRRMMLAAARMRMKIRNLVDELHHKSALFLVRAFDVILLPTFETQKMSKKDRRKIRSKSVRAMLTWSHYRFKQFLKHKAFEHGKMVVDVCEAYTSKTHPETGRLFNVGSMKKIQLSNGAWIDRDISGARNILLRALVDQPQGLFLSVDNC